MGSFFINYCYIMHVYLYTSITKYNLISLYVTLMCVFGGILYGVPSWWICYSLRQTISPTLRTPWWRDALCIRLRPPALSMSLFPCLLLFLFGSRWNSHVGEAPWLSLLTFLGDASHSKAPGSLALTGILSSLLKGSLVLGVTGVLSMYDLRLGSITAFWMTVVFCDGLHLSPREVSLMRTILLHEYKGICLECSYGLYWLNSGGCPPRLH